MIQQFEIETPVPVNRKHKPVLPFKKRFTKSDISTSGGKVKLKHQNLSAKDALAQAGRVLGQKNTDEWNDNLAINRQILSLCRAEKKDGKQMIWIDVADDRKDADACIKFIIDVVKDFMFGDDSEVKKITVEKTGKKFLVSSQPYNRRKAENMRDTYFEGDLRHLTTGR